MPTSNSMPDISVEIAWDGGFRIPMVDWTWTDVSDFVELGAWIDIDWGRGDERSQADANTLTLTFDNSDGRFTAGRPTSPNFPNVKLYKPIRVLADPVDGAQVPLFTGYITSWPVQWEGTSAYAKATVTAASRLSRLGLNARWRSLLEETILASTPVAYYTMGDPDGSQMAADVSGGRSPLPTTSLNATFGQATGPGTDDLTAATLPGTGFATRDLVLSGDVTIHCFSLVEPGASLNTLILGGGDSPADLDTYLGVSSTGKLQANDAAMSSANINDGATHHAAVVWDSVAEAESLHLDGVVVDTASGVARPDWTLFAVGGTAVSTQFFDGVLAHVAIHNTALTSAQIEEISAAGLSGFAGETTDERFERYAAMAGIPAAEVDAEPGATTMVHIDTTGQNIVDMLRIVEQTEAGVLFDALDGTLTLHNRNHRYAASSVLTLDMAKHEVEADYSPRLDPSTLLNDITVTGVVSAHEFDEDSIEANGFATASIATASEDINEPVNLASWQVYKYADPKPRVPSLSVNVTDQASFYAAGESTVSSADLLAVTVGDKITVANHPQQAAFSITDYFVEGGSFSIGPESLRITWNVSPSSPDDQVLIIDDPVRGLLDVNVLAL